MKTASYRKLSEGKPYKARPRCLADRASNHRSKVRVRQAGRKECEI